MMEKKLCLALTVFLIDFVYATEASPVTNFDAPMIERQNLQPITCKMNEIMNVDNKTCEQTCNSSLPTMRCSKDDPPACLCLEQYMRNHLNECVPLTECDQNSPSDSVLNREAFFNITENANFTTNQDILFTGYETVDDVVENLNRSLMSFLESLKDRLPPSSGRNARHTQHKKNSYEYYETLLQESFQQLKDVTKDSRFT